MASRTPARILLLALLTPLLVNSLGLANEADDQYAVAAGLYARRQWKLAADEFQTFVEKYPSHTKHVESLFFLGETLQQLEKYDQAIARFREYLQREPEGSFAGSARFRSAECLYFLRQFDRAKADLTAFAAKYPDNKLNAYVLAYLGNIALAQDDSVSAERQFRLCLSRFPEGQMQDDCRFGLARALEKQAKYDEAERYYLALAGKTASPLAADSQFRLGAMQYARGKYAAAIQSFDAFESTFAKSNWQAMARLGRGWALLKLDRTADAKAFLERIVSDPKVGMEARYWLGLALKAEKNWRQAARTLLDAPPANPSTIDGGLQFHAGLPCCAEISRRPGSNSAGCSPRRPTVSGSSRRSAAGSRWRCEPRTTPAWIATPRVFSSGFPEARSRTTSSECWRDRWSNGNSSREPRRFSNRWSPPPARRSAAGRSLPVVAAYRGGSTRGGVEGPEPGLEAAGGTEGDVLLTRSLLGPETVSGGDEPLEAFLAEKPSGDRQPGDRAMAISMGRQALTRPRPATPS